MTASTVLLMVLATACTSAEPDSTTPETTTPDAVDRGRSEWSYRAVVRAAGAAVEPVAVDDEFPDQIEVVESEDGSYYGVVTGGELGMTTKVAYDATRGMVFKTDGPGEYSAIVRGRTCGYPKPAAPLELILAEDFPVVRPDGGASITPTDVEVIQHPRDYTATFSSTGRADPTPFPRAATFFSTAGSHFDSVDFDTIIRRELEVSVPVVNTGPSVAERIAELEAEFAGRAAAGEDITEPPGRYRVVDDLEAFADASSFQPLWFGDGEPDGWRLIQAFSSSDPIITGSYDHENPASPETLVLCYRNGLQTLAVMQFAAPTNGPLGALTDGGWGDPLLDRTPPYWEYQPEEMSGLDLEVTVDPQVLPLVSPIAVAPLRRPHLWGRRPDSVVAIRFEGPVSELRDVLTNLTLM